MVHISAQPAVTCVVTEYIKEDKMERTDIQPSRSVKINQLPKLRINNILELLSVVSPSGH